ncbi:MAG: hypothetical protein P9L94_06045 [Candidatus Hinthialibacter antarcticus]|nr:hypothetical protein [Candidatus Hinthialibacter antarcticus]
MNDWALSSTLDLIQRFPVLAQTQDGKLPFNTWTPTETDPVTLLSVVGGIVTVIMLIVFGTYQFKKWKQFRTFEDEMRSLDLDPKQEGTFADMVKRYSMDEPVNILYSPRLFDEMAASEMLRVLGSQGSVKAKQEFIDTVYKIRIKTYNPDWEQVADADESAA